MNRKCNILKEMKNKEKNNQTKSNFVHFENKKNKLLSFFFKKKNKKIEIRYWNEFKQLKLKNRKNTKTILLLSTYLKN